MLNSKHNGKQQLLSVSLQSDKRPFNYSTLPMWKRAVLNHTHWPKETKTWGITCALKIQNTFNHTSCVFDHNFLSWLRSAELDDTNAPRSQTARYGEMVHAVSLLLHPRFWNMLPSHLRDKNTSREQFNFKSGSLVTLLTRGVSDNFVYAALNKC